MKDVNTLPTSPFYRETPYIKGYEACCCYDPATASFDIFGTGQTKNGLTEFGPYRFDDRGQMGIDVMVRLSQSSPFILTFEDMMRFKSLITQLGDDIMDVVLLARKGDVEAQYLLCWLDAAKGNCEQLTDFDAEEFLKGISKFDTSEIEESIGMTNAA